MHNDSDSESETSSMSMSDDTTQCLIDSMTIQIQDLQLERESMREANNKLINKLRTYECIIKSDILDKIFKYL